MLQREHTCTATRIIRITSRTIQIVQRREANRGGGAASTAFFS
jgi:hypothetical protein